MVATGYASRSESLPGSVRIHVQGRTMPRLTENRGRCVLRSSLLVVAILIASAGHAQLRNDPQPAVVYDTPQLTVEDCRTTDPSAGDACVANHEEAPAGDYASGYVPDYYGEEAPVYDAAPNVYLGVSLLPYDYWGWPYYGFGYGYAYCCGWPYYGYGWPYYGYAYWGGGYWGGSSHGHGHHDGDHGDWGHHDGGHHDGDHGDWGHHDGGHAGHGSPTVAGAAERTMTAPNSPRAGTALNNRSNFASTPAGAARTSAPTNQFSGANRFASRATLPSASYYSAARATSGANPATSAYASAATNYRGSAGAGYANGRGIAATSTRSMNQAYRGTSMPSRGYAPSAGRASATARSDGYASAQRYAGARTPYAQQHYAPSNRAYASTAMPRSSSSAARGPMPAYSGARGTMPSYARGGSGSAPHGGGHAATAAASHAGGGNYSRGAHGH